MKYFLIAIVVLALVAAGFWAGTRKGDDTKDGTSTPENTVIISQVPSATATPTVIPQVTIKPSAVASPTTAVSNVIIGNRIGNRAPDFRLKDLQGRDVSLRDFIGREKVELYFWTASCGRCVDLLAQNTSSDIILAINRGESTSSIAGVSGRFTNSRIRVLTDSSDTIARLYNVTGMPYSVRIGADGIIHSSSVQ